MEDAMKGVMLSISTPGGGMTPPVSMADFRSVMDEVKRGRGARGARGAMKETPADRAVAQRVADSTGAELRQFIERFEHLEAEKKDIADQQKEVMAEAKGRGYDTRVLRKIIALRKRKPDEIAEEAAVMALYMDALGMGA
jgi:uncharacterized protein (UPF0335 family)